jgi:hypothetical protein
MNGRKLLPAAKIQYLVVLDKIYLEVMDQREQHQETGQDENC